MMRKISTLAMALTLSAATLQAQTVANFDTLSLTGTDTFYVNYSSWGNDVGFDDGLAHFPCVYDSTKFGIAWTNGFVYTNKTDVSDSSYNNPYTAVPGTGYKSSAQYASVYAYSPVKVYVKGKAMGQPVKGFYATNLVYAYKEMTTQGFSKKMGGVPNVDPDWFKITIKGYLNGNLKTDTVDFYLADFRDPDSTKDYVLHSWEWVDLSPLGGVDSLELSLSSTDTAGGFGMNNPAYFAMDNFETFETSSVANVVRYTAKVYPNPANHVLYVEQKAKGYAYVMSMGGQLVKQQQINSGRAAIDISGLTPGVYLLQLKEELGAASVRFVKQ